VYDPWVEMPAALFPDDSAGDLVRKGLLVHALGGQRVIDVRQSDDPAGQRNLLFPKPLRVTGPVETLVVGEGNVTGHGQKSHAWVLLDGRLQRLRPDERMGFHDLKLALA